MLDRKVLFVSMLILVFLAIGTVSATDNLTDEISLDDGPSAQGIENPIVSDIKSDANQSLQDIGDNQGQMNTKMKAKDVTTYYKEKSQLVSYLKDDNNQPVSGKNISISINNRVYTKVTDNAGKAVLKLNLKPGTYDASVNFAGDENYTASSTNAMVKVNKASLKLTAKDFKTYFESGFYFKAKVINKVTKNPVQGIKVAFKVIKNGKHRTYWATTDAKGVAKLKKNLKVGQYRVVTSLKKNRYLNANKAISFLTIKETAEMGCTSLYVQVSNTEAVAGFRRDATNAKTLHIVKYKLNGKVTVKQYKTNSYFFHLLTTADGWMAGTGGIDNHGINQAIEKLAGKMAKSGKIQKSYLKKILGYERELGLGHFSIKAPNGKYAVVWSSGIIYGTLKPGEYLKAPNGRSLFYHGKYAHFSKNPVKAAIKIAASDSYGVNRRDATAFHWKATTKEGKTTSTLKVYAANDNGRLVGSSTGYLKDDIKFRNKFISKNSLPMTPSSKFIGDVKMGNIDKLIKTMTVVSAPKLTTLANESKIFNVTVKNKQTGKPVKALVLKVKIDGKVRSIKTNSKGVAQLKTKSLAVGSHRVIIYTDNIKYLVSAKSTIKII